MTRASCLAVLSIVLGTMLACRQPAAPFTDAHKTAIRDSVTAALEAFKQYSGSGKWDSLAALYSSTPDFRFAESGAIQYESAASIKGALNNGHSSAPVRRGP